MGVGVASEWMEEPIFSTDRTIIHEKQKELNDLYEQKTRSLEAMLVQKERELIQVLVGVCWGWGWPVNFDECK